tara:strand:- start:1312 stop:1800 length:489 start_codon:yes stop_codon:yes gene_type:complete
MNDKQRMLIFFSVLFIIFSVFIINEFRNTAMKDPLQDKNFVVINEKIIFVEVAITPEERQRGLMERESLQEDNGMLFVFSEEDTYSFWMKNMKISLDIIWINADGNVVYFVKDVPPCVQSPCQTYSPNADALYVLEVNPGLIDVLEIEENTEVIISLNNLEN